MKYWVNFSGYCMIEAENEYEAKEKFYEGFQSPNENCLKGDDKYDYELNNVVEAKQAV